MSGMRLVCHVHMNFARVTMCLLSLSSSVSVCCCCCRCLCRRLPVVCGSWIVDGAFGDVCGCVGKCGKVWGCVGMCGDGWGIGREMGGGDLWRDLWEGFVGELSVFVR